MLARLQYVDGYEGGPAGLAARELAARYSERFESPASLVEWAQRGERAQRGEAYSDEAQELLAAG